MWNHQRSTTQIHHVSVAPSPMVKVAAEISRNVFLFGRKGGRARISIFSVRVHRVPCHVIESYCCAMYVGLLRAGKNKTKSHNEKCPGGRGAGGRGTMTGMPKPQLYPSQAERDSGVAGSRKTWQALAYLVLVAHARSTRLPSPSVSCCTQKKSPLRDRLPGSGSGDTRTADNRIG